MKKRLKQICSFGLFCFMVFLAVFTSVASAFDPQASIPPEVVKYYDNLEIEGTDLFLGLQDWFEDKKGSIHNYEQGSFENLQYGELTISRCSYYMAQASFTFRLESGQYYIMDVSDSVYQFVNLNLKNSRGDYVDLRSDGRSSGRYSYIFCPNEEFCLLSFSCANFYEFDGHFYKVSNFESVYDVSRTFFEEDMQYLFDGKIDLSKYSTKKAASNDHKTCPYIDLVAAHSDVVFSEWGTGSVQSGNDYLYIYNSYGEHPVSGTIQFSSEYSAALEVVSTSRFFTKFSTRCASQFNQTKTRRVPIQSITLNFLNGTFRVYPFKDFYISFQYTNQTDWEVEHVIFDGQQKVTLDIDYTYWRQADFSSKGIGWHNQVDSIYFAVPNDLLQGDRLVNAKLAYQKVTTKPIVVTKTGDNINGTYVSQWFAETAANPFNELTHNQGWVRYQKGVPYFCANPSGALSSLLMEANGSYVDYDYSFNVRSGSSRCGDHSLYSVYWAFDVKDPTIVDKIPDNGVNSLQNSALSDPRAIVSREQLEEWMLNYTLVGAPSTVQAATADETGTQAVNAVLFSDIQEPAVRLASDVTGEKLEQFGATHNFWQNLSVGWSYAFAVLTGAVDVSPVELDRAIWEIESLDFFTVAGASDYYKYATSDVDNMKSLYADCQKNDQKMFLVHFDTSQYYSASFWGKYKAGNVDNGDESVFYGYLAIEDLYLDLHVLELYIQNANGRVTPVAVDSNHINGIADVTPAPDSMELGHAAGVALLNQFNIGWSNMQDLLKKALVVILILVIVIVTIWAVSKIVGIFKKNKANPSDRPRSRHRRWRR